MEVVNPLCAGLDVHKQTVVACRLYPDATGKLVKEVVTFETMTDSLIALREWLVAAKIPIVALESTGVYTPPPMLRSWGGIVGIRREQNGADPKLSLIHI